MKLAWIFAAVLLMLSSAAHAQTVSAAERESLLRAREDAWRAGFTNDVAVLHRSFPADTLGINPAEDAWTDQKAVFASAAKFASSGSKLLHLEFPVTEVRRYGNVYVLYSRYLWETEEGGEKHITAGRATEIFLHKNGQWVNPGWHLDSGK